MQSSNFLQWVLNHLLSDSANVLEQYSKMSDVERVRLKAILHRIINEEKI